MKFTLSQGVKLSKITNLQDDIALALGASGVRIAPIPDKISVVGVEVPNKLVSPVSIRTVLESTEFTTHPSTTGLRRRQGHQRQEHRREYLEASTRAHRRYDGLR